MFLLCSYLFKLFLPKVILLYEIQVNFLTDDQFMEERSFFIHKFFEEVKIMKKTRNNHC